MTDSENVYVKFVDNVTKDVVELRTDVDFWSGSASITCNDRPIALIRRWETSEPAETTPKNVRMSVNGNVHVNPGPTVSLSFQTTSGLDPYIGFSEIRSSVDGAAVYLSHFFITHSFASY